MNPRGRALRAFLDPAVDPLLNRSTSKSRVSFPMDDFHNLNVGRRQIVIRVIFSFAVTVLVGVAGYAIIRWLAHLR
jgi:hypothetical protein